MPRVTESTIAAANVRSLAWDGDDLVDWVSGGLRYKQNGEQSDRLVIYAYAFDAVSTSPSGEYALIYSRLATKGLILRRGAVIREINRSYYHADVYEYPATLFALPDGREVIAHCPDSYCRLDIEDLATGERLTDSSARNPGDFFHSRLAASPNGSYLLSAGWLWHPVDAVHVYDVNAALASPIHLDGAGLHIDAWADESSAAFLSDSRLAVSLDGIELDEGADQASPRRDIRVFDLPQLTPVHTSHPVTKVGSIMAVGLEHVLALHQHPKLINILSGEVIREWAHIKSGVQVSSILIADTHTPPMALDAIHGRCAIAGDDAIHVLQFDL